MDKRITLTDEVAKQLRVMAAKANIDVKNYIQNLITSHVLMESIKGKKK
jgi:hypothetical protein